MSEEAGYELVAEGEGDTVGEARWAALRELERHNPGLDEGAVEFVVVSEGVRGLMGVGRQPARVHARMPAPTALSPLGLRVADVVGHVATALDRGLRVTVSERDETITATVSGDAAALVIGRHGHTIDAVQHLVAAITLSPGAERREIVIDAQGYRERRERRLTDLALRAAESALRQGQAMELDPMSSAERRVVHLALAERDDVETSSEGREPERYVVVSPTRGEAPSTPDPD